MRHLVTAFAVLLLTAGSAAADTLTVGFAYAKPPYIFATGPDDTAETRGIEMDILTEVFRRTGDTVVPKYMSYAEVRSNLAAKRIDGGATLKPGAPGLYFSDDYVYFHNFAITRAADGKAVRSYADLKGLRGVGWQGAAVALGPAFQQAAKTMADFDEVPSQRDQVARFLDGTYDVVIIDRAIFRYWAKELGYGGTEFDYGQVFGDRTVFTVGFHDKAVRDRFNGALRDFKKTPEYDAIFEKYLVE